MLEAQGISRIENDKVLFDNVSIVIKPGMIHALIGGSGSGKTSLLDTLALLRRPTAGKLFFSGEEIDFSKNTLKKIWPNVTYITQNYTLFPHLTIEENLLLSLQKQNGYFFPKKISEQNVDGEKFDGELYALYLSQLQIKHLLKKYPHQCSGGERQRVCLIRHLLLKPNVLLLDEITSALDVENVMRVANLLLLSSSKTGILFTTHLLSFAKQVANNVIFMKNGAIKEQGKDILVDPQTSDLQNFLQYSY